MIKSDSFFMPLKELQGHAANLAVPVHMRQSTGLCKFRQRGHITDGTIRHRGGRGLEVLETSAVDKKGDPSGC